MTGPVPAPSRPVPARGRPGAGDAAPARIAAQAAREQRRAVADHVIDNSGSMDSLDARVAETWADLTRRAAAG